MPFTKITESQWIKFDTVINFISDDNWKRFKENTDLEYTVRDGESSVPQNQL